MNNLLHFNYRTLGTPDETVWPGVTQLKEYKSDFPKWKNQGIAKILPQLDKEGVELLKVKTDGIFNIQNMQYLL